LDTISPINTIDINLPTFNRNISKQSKALYISYIVSKLVVFTPLISIKSYLSNKGMSSATIQRYITKAKAIIADRPNETRDSMLQAHISQREALLQETTDQRVRLEISKDIARLQGLYETNINVHHTSDKLKDASTDELINIVSIQEVNE
jgi:hypothetical protein